MKIATITVKDSADHIEKSIHFDGNLIATIIESPRFSYDINTTLCHTVHSGVFHEYYFDGGLVLTIFENGGNGTFNITQEEGNENTYGYEESEGISTEYRYIEESLGTSQDTKEETD